MKITDAILQELKFEDAYHFWMEFGQWLYAHDFKTNNIKNIATVPLGQLVELYIKEEREEWLPRFKENPFFGRGKIYYIQRKYAMYMEEVFEKIKRDTQ